WTGGCVVEDKKTSFSLRPQAELLSARLFEEPDARVRNELLRALSWGGRRRFLPQVTRFFTEADRREELADLMWTVWTFFNNPEEGLEQRHDPRPPDDEATWVRFKAYAESLRETSAARRNGIVLVLTLAIERRVSLSDDRLFLGRVVEWLGGEEDLVREEDLHLIVHQWKVMDPE